MPPRRTSLEKGLQANHNRDIIDMKNKNAAVSRCANTWKPMQVMTHLHNGRKAAPHELRYDNPAFL